MTDISTTTTADTENRPCIGLDPDTDPCPFCGASASDPCGAPFTFAWRQDPADLTHVQQWNARGWETECYLSTADKAAQWVATNIKEAREDDEQES